jgi:SAM-dependent methyltransferase
LDDVLGTETGEIVALSDLTVVEGDSGEGFMYVGEHPRVTRWWLRALPTSLEAFTFVDLGSGKGRVLFVAAEREFRHVVGVEFAKELHEVTVENAARVRASTGREILPVLGDAGAFAFPLDPLVVHLNNPFTESVMSRVIANLEQSYAERPRPIIVVYQQARQEDDATENVAKLAEASFLAHRSLDRSGPLDRFLLKPWVVDIFESPEVRS